MVKWVCIAIVFSIGCATHYGVKQKKGFKKSQYEFKR